MIFKIIILSAAIISALGLCSYAQQASVSIGGNASGSGGSASYTAGQVAYIPSSGSQGSSTPGVQQPFEIFVVTEIESVHNIKLEISAFPNPTVNDLTLTVNGVEFTKLSFQLFDMSGNLIQKGRIEGRISVIHMKEFIPASYFLKITQGNQNLKTFNIIKN